MGFDDISTTNYDYTNVVTTRVSYDYRIIGELFRYSVFEGQMQRKRPKRLFFCRHRGPAALP